MSKYGEEFIGQSVIFVANFGEHVKGLFQLRKVLAFLLRAKENVFKTKDTHSNIYKYSDTSRIIDRENSMIFVQ